MRIIIISYFVVMYNNSLGSKIQNFRKRAALSQMDLELAIVASPGTMSRIENGTVNPTKETLVKISKALKLNFIDTASLFGIDVKVRIESIKITRSILRHTQNQAQNLK